MLPLLLYMCREAHLLGDPDSHLSSQNSEVLLYLLKQKEQG